jgi:hypothetical protein
MDFDSFIYTKIIDKLEICKEEDKCTIINLMHKLIPEKKRDKFMRNQKVLDKLNLICNHRKICLAFYNFLSQLYQFF